MLKARTTEVDKVLLCVTITLLSSKANGADPVFTPTTISDASGNSVDQDAVITWADLPAGSPYNAGNPSRVSEGLTPYYNFMHSFVGSVFPTDIPDSVIENIANGTVDKIISNYSNYINVFIGYAICVAVGVLFFLIFPIVACCFCCCRCCGNCGGKMIQKDEEAENSCARNTFAILLAVMLAFITVGMVCAFLNNSNTTTAIDGIADTARSNLDDIKIFVNNTVDEANHIARNNYEFLKSALVRDIDNIGYLAGIPLRTTIKSNTGIDSVITSAYALNDDLTQASTDLDDVNAKLTNLNNSLVELETALTNVKTNLDAAYTACGAGCTTGGPDYTTGTAVGLDSSQFPDLSTQTADMTSATGQNLTEKVAEAEKELDDIPWRVHNDSETSRNDIKTAVENLSDDFDPMLNSVDDVNRLVYGPNASVDLNKYEEKIDEYADIASKYNKYRWYGGIGLVCVILLIVVLAVLGLIFGLVSCDTSVNPPERGCLSNSGGNLLIASAVFIFIFAALLMLLTTLTFILGAPLERFVCQTITDPSLTQMEKWVDGTYNKISAGDGKYFLGNMFFQNNTIALTLTGILRDCKANEGAFEAFQLSSQFDITDLLNYSKTLDVDAEIDQVNVNLSTVKVFPASLQTQLTDLKNAININFTKFYEELNKSPTSDSLNTLADDLDTYAGTVGDPTFTTAINTQTAELRRIETEEVVYVNGNITALNTSVNAMETTVSGLPASIDSIETGLTDTETYIHNNASNDVKALLKVYATRLTGIADSFVSYTDNAVRTGLGKCVPVWNVYESFMVYTFCYNLMDTFNGFWFSLGWCVFFFIPSLIFSFKYARFLRRMDYVPEDEIPPKPDRSLPTPQITDNNSKPMFRLSNSGITCNGDDNKSAAVANMDKPLDEPQKETVKTVNEYTKIYPDLSNRYTEPHDSNAGDYFTLPDNMALISKENSESAKGMGSYDALGKTKEPDNICNKNDYIISEMQDDEHHLFTRQATFENKQGSNAHDRMAETNEPRKQAALFESNTKRARNMSIISEDEINDKDTSCLEVERNNESYNTRNEESYSADQFEQSVDGEDKLINNWGHDINTVANSANESESLCNEYKPNVDNDTNIITDESRTITDNVTPGYDRTDLQQSIFESHGNSNRSPVKQTINVKQINVNPVQQPNIDSEIAELARL